MSEINFNNIQKNSDNEEDYDNYVEDIVEEIDEDMNGDGDDEQRDIDYNDDDVNDINDDDDNNNEKKKDDDDDDDDDDDVVDDDIDEDEVLNTNEQDNTLLKSEGKVGGSSKEMTLIGDYRKYKHLKTLSCSTKITRPILTKYEKTSILGQRAQQILNGSNILVDIKTLKVKNPLEIARKELKEGLIPFIVRRPLPNGTYEDWKVSDLKDINF